MPKAPPPYPPEFREEAVRLTLTSGKRLAVLAKDLGISYETLRTWVKRHQVDAGNAPGLTTSEREELRKLRRENRILREEREILRKAAVDSTCQRNMATEVSHGEDGSAGDARRAQAGVVGPVACGGSVRSRWRWRNRRARCSRSCGITAVSPQRRADGDRGFCRWLSARRSLGGWRAASRCGR